MRGSWVLTTVLGSLLLLLVVGCGGDDSGENDGDDTSGAETQRTTASAGSPSAPSSTDTGDAAAALKPGTLRLDGKDYELKTVTCTLPAQKDGPFALNAETVDGKGRIRLAGLSGLAAITTEYDGVGYLAPGSKPEFKDGAMLFNGRATVADSPSKSVELRFHAVC